MENDLILKNKELKSQLEIEINMKNNLLNFILCHGLMKELHDYEKKYPLEVADTGRVPLVKHMDENDPEFVKFEKTYHE